MRRSDGTKLMWAALVLAAGCAGGGQVEKERSPQEKQRIEAAIARGEVLLGMTRSDVRRAWGAPASTRRVQRSARRQEMWTYPSTALFFDEDGYLVDWDSPLG